ncbi:MAG: type II secretion system minor pseudopilin GspK [Magnetococcales bacterium]|nr:type II secretion system minor pseudopilin GspK [Magnetococcales bacterium]MBF0321763.1 type II secretion system minor pseudopilin GspK [Magnetococcales bacterium]
MIDKWVPGARTGERGVALIMALLIVAMATTAIVSMVNAQRIDLRRTENIFFRNQAILVAYGGEVWAKKVLTRDAAESRLDSLDENWARRLAPMTLENGVVSGYIEDMEGRFNLNNLVSGGSQSLLDMERFRRLLLLLRITPDLAYAVADWIDNNGEIGGPGGAEDPDYLAMDPPYRAANKTMSSPSELMSIKGFDFETCQKLAPFVTALPTYTSINVNTASPMVLRILADDLKDADVERLVERRKQKPYESMNDFLKEPSLAHSLMPQRGIGVLSQHFLVTIQVRAGNTHLHLFSLLQRGSNGVSVLVRGQGAI